MGVGAACGGIVATGAVTGTGIDGGGGKRAIGLNGADESLIDENLGSGNTALDGQRSQARLRLEVLGLQIPRLQILGLQTKDKSGLFAFADADRLLGRILEAALRDFYNVVLGLEIRQAQLAGLSQLRLKVSVEKNFCVVLTGNDNERALAVTRLGGRLIVGRLIVGRLIIGRPIIDRGVSSGGVGRNTRSRRRWFGSCLCGAGDGRSGDDGRWGGRSWDGGR